MWELAAHNTPGRCSRGGLGGSASPFLGPSRCGRKLVTATGSANTSWFSSSGTRRVAMSSSGRQLTLSSRNLLERPRLSWAQCPPATTQLRLSVPHGPHPSGASACLTHLSDELRDPGRPPPTLSHLLPPSLGCAWGALASSGEASLPPATPARECVVRPKGVRGCRSSEPCGRTHPTYLKNSFFSSSLFKVRLFKKFTTSRKSFLSASRKK